MVVNQLCDQNLGAQDYLEIVKNCKFMVIDQIPQFNDIRSEERRVGKECRSRWSPYH